MSYATFMQNLIDNSNMSLDELANKLDMTTVAIRKIMLKIQVCKQYIN